MALTTKTKMALAGIAYRTIATGRAIVGKSDSANVRRGGVQWCLDLSEGIDFSIYLLGAFERSTRATLQKLVKPGDIVFDIGRTSGRIRWDWLKAPDPTARFTHLSQQISRSES